VQKAEGEGGGPVIRCLYNKMEETEKEENLVWCGEIKGGEEVAVGGAHISGVALGVIHVLQMCRLIQDLVWCSFEFSLLSLVSS